MLSTGFRLMETHVLPQCTVPGCVFNFNEIYSFYDNSLMHPPKV